MDPFALEHLIKLLLEEMDYQNVEVTSRSSDGEVDVVADIEVGITSIREVVQTKRHRTRDTANGLNALRGSLYRFDAVRGTIVTTSSFSKGTLNAAFATGAPPSRSWMVRSWSICSSNTGLASAKGGGTAGSGHRCNHYNREGQLNGNPTPHVSRTRVYSARDERVHEKACNEMLHWNPHPAAVRWAWDQAGRER